jgi:hypothetical protein
LVVGEIRKLDVFVRFRAPKSFELQSTLKFQFKNI